MSVGFNPERGRFLIDLLAPERLTQVCDIGANPLDETPYKGLLSIGGCDVWGFEPQQAAFDKLMADKGPHENYLCHAIGDGKTAELKVCADDGFTSLLEPNQRLIDSTGQFVDRLKVVDRIKIKTSKLDSLKDLPQFDLLKIDIQGGEQAVFRGGRTKIAKALAVITEVSAVPVYVDQPLLHDQMATLAKHGFFLHKFLFMKSIGFRNPYSARLPRPKYRSQLSDGDAVMVRGMFEMEALTVEELKHLAILADTVLLTQDLAVTAMVQLKDRGEISDAQVHSYIDMLPYAKPHDI